MFVIRRLGDGLYYLGGGSFWSTSLQGAKTFRFKTVAELHGVIAIDLPVGAWAVEMIEGA